MAVLKMWGNSAALRIPISVLEKSHFTMDEPLVMHAEKGRIVIESSRPSYDIDELISAIKPDNLPAFQPHAQAVGAEQIEW